MSHNRQPIGWPPGFKWDSSGKYCNVFKLTSECFVEPKGVNRHSCTNIYACRLLCNSSSCSVYFLVVLAECTNDTRDYGVRKNCFPLFSFLCPFMYQDIVFNIPHPLLQPSQICPNLVKKDFACFLVLLCCFRYKKKHICEIWLTQVNIWQISFTEICCD